MLLGHRCTLEMSFQAIKVLHDCSSLAQVLRKPKNTQKSVVGLAIPKKRQQDKGILNLLWFCIKYISV